MSSANRRLVIFLPLMLTFPACSSRAAGMIRSRNMLKRVGDRSHPCLTSTAVLNHSPMLPFISTALLVVVRTRSALMLHFHMVAHKAACHTMSKAFFEINEGMVQIPLMLKVVFTQDCEVKDLFCGA